MTLPSDNQQATLEMQSVSSSG